MVYSGAWPVVDKEWQWRADDQRAMPSGQFRIATRSSVSRRSTPNSTRAAQRGRRPAPSDDAVAGKGDADREGGLMAEIKLTTEEANVLIAMEKHRANEDYSDFPMRGQSLTLPLQSIDKREQFLLDLSRGRSIWSKSKC